MSKLLPLFLLACYELKSIAPKEPVNLVTDWRNEVVYQLMVDRFANGDITNDYGVDLTNANSYHGGDWQGIIDHLDYLKDLGVTAIWISPVVQNVDSDSGIGGYHGYWAQDFTQPNPHFGDVAKLRQLSDAVHEKGMKIILDIVTNHVGQLFYYDINKNGQPDILIEGSGASSNVQRTTEYDPDFKLDGIRAFTSLGDAGPAPVIWFNQPEINRTPPSPAVLRDSALYHRRGRVTDWNNPEQVELGDFPGGLKDLKTEAPEVRQAMIDVYARWAELIDFDGFRIDTVKHVEHEFWQQFCRALREHAKARGKRQFVMFGEIFDGNDQKVGSYTKDNELDAVVNFPAKYQIFEDVIKTNRKPTKQVQTYWESRAANYGAQPAPDGVSVAPINLPFNFLDNHDVERFLADGQLDTQRFLAGASTDALKQALLVLMTMPGVPIIYYGTEQGYTGKNDPSNREDMWASGFSQDHELYKWVQKLAKLRAKNEPLRTGTMSFRWTTDRQVGEDAGILAFARTAGDVQVLVVINTSDAGTSHTAFEDSAMITGFTPGAVLKDLLTNDRYETDDTGGLVLELAPRQNLVLVEQ